MTECFFIFGFKCYSCMHRYFSCMLFLKLPIAGARYILTTRSKLSSHIHISFQLYLSPDVQKCILTIRLVDFYDLNGSLGSKSKQGTHSFFKGRRHKTY